MQAQRRHGSRAQPPPSQAQHPARHLRVGPVEIAAGGEAGDQRSLQRCHELHRGGVLRRMQLGDRPPRVGARLAVEAAGLRLRSHQACRGGAAAQASRGSGAGHLPRGYPPAQPPICSPTHLPAWQMPGRTARPPWRSPASGCCGCPHHMTAAAGQVCGQEGGALQRRACSCVVGAGCRPPTSAAVTLARRCRAAVVLMESRSCRWACTTPKISCGWDGGGGRKAANEAWAAAGEPAQRQHPAACRKGAGRDGAHRSCAPVVASPA